MIVEVTGVGIWARGLRTWADLARLVRDDQAVLDTDFTVPQPAAIPARELRRAPLSVKLAVEVAHQACEMAGVEKNDVASVFASAMGDTDIIEDICRALSAGENLLSPTKFHNSVHNAPSGYWSISATNRMSTTFISAFVDSFAAGLLEALMICVTDDRPTLLVSYDIGGRPPFDDVCARPECFAAALLLENKTRGGWDLSVEMAQHDNTTRWPKPLHPALKVLAAGNPAARCLALLESFAHRRAGSFEWATGDVTCVRVVIQNGGPLVDS